MKQKKAAALASIYIVGHILKQINAYFSQRPLEGEIELNNIIILAEVVFILRHYTIYSLKW